MEQILGIGSRVKHPAFGDGVVIEIEPAAYRVCYILHGIKLVGKNFDGWEVVDRIELKQSVSFTEAEEGLVKILRAWSGMTEEIELGDKWDGGTLILKPGESNLQNKEMPIDTFFHKIVMVRDRLRVMEQRINSSKNMSDEEKVNLQQYITRIYGSLTSFNVLFKFKKDHFVGERTNA